MRRRLPWILAILLVLVVGAAAALVVAEKPTLDDARDAVDARWQPLRPTLVARYEQLDTVLAALGTAGGGDRSVAHDLTGALAAWKKALADGDAGTQAEAANRLEGEAVRVRANVLASARLAEAGELTNAIAAFTAAVPPQNLVQAYNRAVRAYEDDRNDSFRKPVARLLGYDARPVLMIERVRAG
jgi:hypothetical protein